MRFRRWLLLKKIILVQEQLVIHLKMQSLYQVVMMIMLIKNVNTAGARYTHADMIFQSQLEVQVVCLIEVVKDNFNYSNNGNHYY